MYERLTPKCLSEYRMDRHLLSLEDQEEYAETIEHLKHCAKCRREMTLLRQDREAFLQHAEQSLPQSLLQLDPPEYKPQTHPPEASPSSKTGWTWRPTWLGAVPWRWTSGALAFCLLLLLVPGPWRSWRSQRYIATRAGQSPTFMVALQRDGTARLARPGELFKHRDRIRLAYRWPGQGDGYLFVIHRDQNNMWSPLYPENTTQRSLHIKRGKERALPGSLEVDNATHGHEEIWACFSKQPLSYERILQLLPKLTPGQPWTAQPRLSCTHLWRFHFARGMD